MTESDVAAATTVELLEDRLRRLCYLVTGETNWAGIPTQLPTRPETVDDTVLRRLARLESDLEKLSRNVPCVREVIQLCMWPSFFP